MKALLLAVTILLLPQLTLAGGSSVVVAIASSPNVPPAKLRLRADYVAVPISIHSDARDPLKRIDQIENSLRGISERIKQHPDLAVRFGVVSLSPREPSKSFSSYESYGSSAQLYALGPLKADTTVFAVTKRIHQIVTGASAADGAKVVLGTTTLGMDDPERFRPKLLSLISQAASEARRSLGASGPIDLEGLENPIAVMQIDESDVVLFINYRVKIQMRAT